MLVGSWGANDGWCQFIASFHEEAACLSRSRPGLIGTMHDTHQAGQEDCSKSSYAVAPERGFHSGRSGNAANGFLVFSAAALR